MYCMFCSPQIHMTLIPNVISGDGAFGRWLGLDEVIRVDTPPTTTMGLVSL